MSCSARNVLILPQTTTYPTATVTGVTSFLILDHCEPRGIEASEPDKIFQYSARKPLVPWYNIMRSKGVRFDLSGTLPTPYCQWFCGDAVSDIFRKPKLRVQSKSFTIVRLCWCSISLVRLGIGLDTVRRQYPGQIPLELQICRTEGVRWPGRFETNGNAKKVWKKGVREYYGRSRPQSPKGLVCACARHGRSKRSGGRFDDRCLTRRITQSHCRLRPGSCRQGPRQQGSESLLQALSHCGRRQTRPHVSDRQVPKDEDASMERRQGTEGVRENQRRGLGPPRAAVGQPLDVEGPAGRRGGSAREQDPARAQRMPVRAAPVRRQPEPHHLAGRRHDPHALADAGRRPGTDPGGD
eukprot:2298262-Rhodomonas_salina.1